MTGTMHTMDLTGDTKVEWDADNANEVAAARAQFETLVGKKGFLAYRVTDRGGNGEQLRAFDPQAEKIILVPALRGG